MQGPPRAVLAVPSDEEGIFAGMAAGGPVDLSSVSPPDVPQNEADGSTDGGVGPVEVRSRESSAHAYTEITV